MTKTDAIRKVFLATGRELSIDELIPMMERRLKMLVGRQKLYTLLAVLQVAGEIKIRGRGDDRKYRLKGMP